MTLGGIHFYNFIGQDQLIPLSWPWVQFPSCLGNGLVTYRGLVSSAYGSKTTGNAHGWKDWQIFPRCGYSQGDFHNKTMSSGPLESRYFLPDV